MIPTTTITGRRGALRTVAAALLLPLAMTGCENLLEVEAASRVEAENLETPAGAKLLVKSAVGDFDCALASYITTTGQVVDEFMGVNIYSAEAFDYDRRTVDPTRRQYATFECGAFGAIYQPLSTAIWQADNALEKLNSFSDAEVGDRAKLIQTVQAYGGYGRVLLGEGFCSAAINLGPELTPAEIFRQAETLFTNAMGGPDPTLATMARLGRARVRHNVGDDAGALEDARSIPEGFIVNARYSSATTRSQNEVYNRNNRLLGVGVWPTRWETTFQRVPDSRIPVVNTGDTGPDGYNVVRAQLKYTSLDAPIPIARWAEARLIIAELEGGQTAVDIINRLHDGVGLPHFKSTDPAEISAQVIEERARELFLEGHRFYDFNRFDLPFDPAVGTPYQQKGGFYGDTRCFPLPDIERDNNPNMGSR